MYWAQAVLRHAYARRIEMKKEELDNIILKALASQIILTEQAIYKGESLVDAIDHDPLSHHLWEETAIHAQLVTIRRRELKEYQAAYSLLKGKSFHRFLAKLAAASND